MIPIHRFLLRGAILLALVFFACAQFSAPASRAVRFDPASDGLVMIETETNGKINRYAVAPGKNVMETGAFEPDEMQVFTARCFTLGENRVTRLCVTDENGKMLPATQEISAICYAMREIGHDVISCRIFHVNSEWFASVMLNVNLWTPYRLYYYNQETEKLVWLCTLADEDVSALRIVSAGRLAALRQESIGGSPPPDPEAFFYSHRLLFDSAADMLFSRSDLFEEIRGRFRRSSLAADGLCSYDSLSDSPWIASRLSESEQQTLLALTDGCLPYQISFFPGDANACPALAFEFSVFLREEQRQKDCVLLRLPAEAAAQARLNALRALRDRYGEWAETGDDPWYIVYSDPVLD